MKLSDFLPWSKRPKVNNVVPTQQQSKKKSSKLSEMTVPQRIYRCDVQQSELDQAIMIAEDPINPRRYALISILKWVIKDSHLRSQMRTAINEVLEEPWAVYDQNGNESEDLTKLLDKGWRTELLTYFLQAEFWGHSLVEFQELVYDQKLKNFVFDKVKLLPREHVCPENGLYLLRPTDLLGLPFRDAPYKDNLIECGDPYNLGELRYCASDSIRKLYGVQDWARSGEKWMDPILGILTESDDKKELDKKEEFARNFGNNGYYIGDKSDDEITLLERKNADGYKITESLCKYLDEENSKAVNGQVATSQANAYVGSSEVQQDVLDGYSSKRLKDLFTFQNEKLLPFLIAYNDGNTAYAQLDGCEIKRKIPEPMQSEQGSAQAPKDSKQPQGGQGGKKSLTARYDSVSSQIEVLYLNTCDCEDCRTLRPLVSNSINVDDLITASIRRLYDRKIAIGQPDAEIWKYNAENLFNGVIQGTSYNMDALKYGSSEHRLIMAMRYNTSVTAAFKSHQNSLEIAAQLFDENGKLRNFSQFNKAVKPIAEKYNKNYLLTEFNTATGRARSAAQEIKWRKKGGKARFHTQKDGRVREKHKKYEGVTLALDDPFWLKNTPPIWGDWGCRCFRRLVPITEPDKAAESEIEHNGPDVTSPYQSMKAFLDDMPYFEVDQDFADLAADLFHLPIPLSPEEFDRNVRRFEALKGDTNYKLLFTDNRSGGFLFRHVNSKQDELADLSKYGRNLVSEFGDSVVIREYMDQATDKQPDFIVNLEIAELKVNKTGSKNTIDYLLRLASKQASHVIISVPDMDKTVLQKLIYERVKRGSIQLLTIVFNGKASRWTKEQILEGYLSL